MDLPHEEMHHARLEYFLFFYAFHLMLTDTYMNNEACLTSCSKHPLYLGSYSLDFFHPNCQISLSSFSTVPYVAREFRSF